MPSGNGALVVAVGDVPVALCTTDKPLLTLLERRFRRFLAPSASPVFSFDITVIEDDVMSDDAELQVRCGDGQWQLRRGDFSAVWDPNCRRGSIRQTRNPYAVDAVLRIVHTLLLSTEGGFLLHASSAVRNGRAFLFTGPSGAGKTTIARLAPDDVTVLTDEISYVRKGENGYVAFGTPFSGEWADVGENVSAPVSALFRLDWGPDNERTSLGSVATVRTLMRNMLFFADDPSFTGHLLDAACDFAAAVPAFRLAFAPDQRVWDAIA